MKKVLCEVSNCKYNSSCCMSSTQKELYCTRDVVHFYINEETCQMDCKNYEEDFENKEVECHNCQISRYGGIRLNPRLYFIDKNTKDSI